jgi:hypothetical protein
MTQTYLSVPRLHRLEYLDALLNSYEGESYDETRARHAIQHEIQEYEQRKARALRRQRPHASEGVSTLAECLEMALHLDLIDRKKRLKPKAALVLDPARRRSFLLQNLWQIYPRFSQVVLTARNVGRLDLPFYNWDEFRKQGGNLHGLDMDRKNFEIMRDFLTQLGLINWHPIENSRQMIYTTACVATRSELICMVGSPAGQYAATHLCLQTAALETGILAVREGHYLISTDPNLLPTGYLNFQTDIDQVYIIDHMIASADFEQCLWREYLKLSDMIPMSPVLYPSLRNQVCATLALSDQVFDHQLFLLIKHPQKLNIHPSDGTLNYAAHLAHIGKFLPPQTSEGNFIVYLKIERSNTL